jgi:hypothetical protein
MILQMQALHEEIEGPRIEVVRDGDRQKIYPKVPPYFQPTVDVRLLLSITFYIGYRCR